MKWRCSTCGGEYDDILPDGTLYFHACPPIFDPETDELIERPDARNENIVEDRKTGRVWIKAEGKGRTKVEKMLDEKEGLNYARDPRTWI